MRNATPLRTFSLIREAQNEAKKTHEQDGAKARAQERLEQYRRAQEQAALDLRMSEEMKRSRRKEVRVALELAKQRKREEVYAANQVLALSEAARMRLILKSLEEGSLGREVIREDGSLQQRGV